MSAGKWTPGPWRVEETSVTSVVWGELDKVVSPGSHGKPGRAIAHLSHNSSIGPETQRINARLIAATPDLLDVAEAIVTAYGDRVLRDHTEEHLYQGAQAALAKARGGKP